MLTVNLIKYSRERDLDLLYGYMLSSEYQALFSHKLQINTINSFEHWLMEMLQTSYHDFFMIESGGRPIGFTFSYDFSINDRHCKFTLCLFNEYKQIGYGAIAGAKMLEYLFKDYSLNQVFTSVFDFNEESLAMHRHIHAQEVGVFPNYRYYDGKYYSLHTFLIDRDCYHSFAQKIIAH